MYKYVHHMYFFSSLGKVCDQDMAAKHQFSDGSHVYVFTTCLQQCQSTQKRGDGETEGKCLTAQSNK